MRRVLSTFGSVIQSPVKDFDLPRQGDVFVLERVFFEFVKGMPDTDTWYFSLIHKNGENAEIARTSTTESEPSLSTGQCHFFKGDVEFRSHVNAHDSQIMTAPLGCEGWVIDTNDTVTLRFDSADGSPLSEDISLSQIYWHCVFESEKKG